MTRWIHPPRHDRPRERDRFDPIAEGARYQLSRELSQQIWAKAWVDASDASGRRDEQQARRKFHEIAAQMAARRGRRRPDVGRLTRVGNGADDELVLDAWSTDALRPHVPGRDTLVAAEQRRWRARHGRPANGSPEAATSSTSLGLVKIRDQDINGEQGITGPHGIASGPPDRTLRLDLSAVTPMNRLFGSRHDAGPAPRADGADGHPADPKVPEADEADGKGDRSGRPGDRVARRLDTVYKPVAGTPLAGTLSLDGKHTLHPAQGLLGHGPGLAIFGVVDPRTLAVAPKNAALLAAPVAQDRIQPIQPIQPNVPEPRLKGLDLKTKKNLDHDHGRDAHGARHPLRGSGGGRRMTPPPVQPPPAMDPKLLASNQTAFDAYIGRYEKERAKAKDNVTTQTMAKARATQIDTQAIAAQVKQTNAIKLGRLRADSAHDRVATNKAGQVERQQGEVTLASLKARLENQVIADKQKLKGDLDLKTQELTLRLQTQQETLVAESNKQIEHLRRQRDQRAQDATRRWNNEKQNFTRQAEDLMVRMRFQTDADRGNLKDQQQKTMQVASARAAAVERDANGKAHALFERGNAYAKSVYDGAVSAGNSAYAAAKADAASVLDKSLKSEIIAAGEASRRDFIQKGELSSQDIKAKAKEQALALKDAGKVQKQTIIDAAANEVQAIDDKINSLQALADKRVAENEQALQKTVQAGQAALDKQLADLQSEIDQKQKDVQAKLTALDDDGAGKLQADYDRELQAIDQKANVARAALDHGSQKTVAQLEKLVDNTLTQIDQSVVDTEKRFDATIASAEIQAAAHVMAALRAIKADADKLLVAIDQEYDARIQAVKDAVVATRKQINDTARGKMLEIEVHVATMFADLGQTDRLVAVKKQLRWYVENGQAAPMGYGEVAQPPPGPANAGATTGAASAAVAGAIKTPEQEAADKKKAEQADDERWADLDPEERAKENADKAKQEQDATAARDGKPSDAQVDAAVEALLKKGQTATAVAAEDSARAAVQTAYDDGRHAINHVANQKRSEIKNLEQTGSDAELAQFKVDQKAGKDAAGQIASAANREGFWGKNPDKKAIVRALDGKTPAQIEAMRAALLAMHPPINLDDLIEHTLSGDEQKEARIRMTGNPTAGDVQALLGASGWTPSGNEKSALRGFVIGGDTILNRLSGAGVDRARIEEILARYKDPAELARFGESFERETGLSFKDFLVRSGLTGEALAYCGNTAAEDKKRADDQADLLEKAEADRTSKKIKPEDIGKSVNQLRDALDNFHLDGTRADMVAKALDGKTPEEIALIMADFKKQPGSMDLEARLRATLGGAALAQAEATIHNDKDQIAVSKLMGAEQSAWTPWTVDDKKLQDTLEGITDPAQRRRVLAMYKAQTGVDLATVIEHKMTGNDRRLAQCLAQGDTDGANEVKLEEAAHGGWLNSIEDTAAERFGIPKSVTKAFVTMTVTPQGWNSTVDGYSTRDGGIHKVDSDQALKVMESIKDPAARARVAARYKQSTGTDLDADMKALLGGTGDPLTSGAKYDAFHALMQGDSDTATAAEAKAALSDGVFHDKDAFYKQFEGKSASDRDRAIAAYNRKYGGGNPHAFQSFITSHLDGLDRDKANLLVEAKGDAATGLVTLPPEFELRYAMDSVWVRAAHRIDGGVQRVDRLFGEHPKLRLAANLLTFGGADGVERSAKLASRIMSNWGVDDDKVLQVLRDNPELVKTLDPRIRAEVQYTMSGRSLHEAQYYLDHGVPQTPDEAIKFQISMYQFDRGNSNWFSKGITDAFSVSGKDYDYEYQQLLALQVQIEACQKAGLPIPPELAAQASWTAGLTSATGDQYNADKSKVAEAVAVTVAVVAGAVVTVATGGVAGAVLGALVAGVATIGTKAAIMGDSYTRGEMGVDIVMTAVNAATAGVLKAEPFAAFCEKLTALPKAAQQLLNAVVSGAGASAVSSMAETMLTSKDAHDLLGLIVQGANAGVWAGITGGANAAAMHALDSLLGSLMTKLFKTNAINSEGEKYREPALIERMIKGYVSGGSGAIASMAVEAIADPSILDGNWDTVLANAMERFHEGGFQNALQAGSDHIEKTRTGALEEAVRAAKDAQAAGLSPEAQRAAFAQTLAEAAQTEAARAGKQLDGTPIADLPRQLVSHSGVEAPQGRHRPGGAAGPESPRQVPALEPRTRRVIEAELAGSHRKAALGELSDADLMALHRQAQIEQLPAQLDTFRRGLSEDAGAKFDELRAEGHVQQEPVDHALAQRLTAALETPVRYDETLPPNTVRVVYEKGLLGNLKQIGIVAGPDTTVADILFHAPTVTALRRYEGLAGLVHRTLDAARGLVSGGYLPPGSRAHEAYLELQKLPAIIDAHQQRLAAEPLDEQTRAHVTALADALESELAHHMDELGDLGKGVGHVAAEPKQDRLVRLRTPIPDDPVEVQKQIAWLNERELSEWQPQRRKDLMDHLDWLLSPEPNGGEVPAFKQAKGESLADYEHRLQAMSELVKDRDVKDRYDGLLKEVAARRAELAAAEAEFARAEKARRVAFEDWYRTINNENFQERPGLTKEAKEEADNKYAGPRKRAAMAKAYVELLKRMGSPEWRDYNHDATVLAEPCFAPGTIVKTPAGDVPIEQLFPGQLVDAHDVDTGISAARRVLRVHAHWTDRLVRVHVDGEVILATWSHPFWLDERRVWCKAGDLRAGDVLRGQRRPLVVSRVELDHDVSPTFNLEVEEFHTFHVGAAGVLVHNGVSGEEAEARDSNFEDAATKYAAKFYEIRYKLDDGTSVVLYVGKTWQNSVQDRFKQHMKAKGWKSPPFSCEKIEVPLHLRRDMSAYEVAVWEKYFINKQERINLGNLAQIQAGLPPSLGFPGKGFRALFNDIDPITAEKAKEFSSLYEPCR